MILPQKYHLQDPTLAIKNADGSDVRSQGVLQTCGGSSKTGRGRRNNYKPSYTNSLQIYGSMPHDINRPGLPYELMSEKLKWESERRKTFKNWPVKFLDSKKLAQNGFYYNGNGDTVICVFCGGQFGFWEQGDDPQKDHAEWCRKCVFVKGKNCGNIPLSEDPTSNSEVTYENGDDVFRPYGNVLHPFSGPERTVTALGTVNTSTLWKDLKNLGISKKTDPVSPHYGTIERRLKTFQKWPDNHPQSPQKLAEAGFYYTSRLDETCCFDCGGALKCWQEDSDPWIEHARWFSECGFINIQKGRDFITKACSWKKTYLTPKSIEELGESKPESCEAVEKPTEEPAGTGPSTSGPSANPSLGISSISQSVLCIICCSRERAIVFLPCGHFVSCSICAASLSTCALCRTPYQATVRAYLS